MPASAARTLSRRCNSFGTLRIWIITDMLSAYEHVLHMSIDQVARDHSVRARFPEHRLDFRALRDWPELSERAKRGESTERAT